MKPHFFREILFLCGFLLSGCAEKENPKLNRLREKAVEFSHKQKELEDSIQKLGDSDFGKKNLLSHELELLKSRLLRLEEEAKTLNGGKELPLVPPSSQASGGH